MFSVIIPLYNKAPYVEKAIQSILSQTYREFEIIVVNDGSVDNSLEVVRKIDFGKVEHTIIDQENAGVSTARNNGVKQTKCDYIAFLDADDWWKPTFLEEMRCLIEKYPQASIYGSGYYLVKNGKKRIAPIGVEADFNGGIINYCQVYAKTLCMPIWTGAAVIPKSIFEEQNGFKPHLRLGEDFDLWIRIALKYPVAFVNKQLAYYNQDIDVEDRAVVRGKIYEPNTHFIFNLDFLKQEEEQNQDLKYLLDKLRLYTLFRYRLQNTYKKEWKREIEKVDFSKQSFSVKMNYKLPRLGIVFLNNVKIFLSKLKNSL